MKQMQEKPWLKWLLWAVAIAALLVTLCEVAGCQWATHERIYDRPQTIITKTEPAKRYFRLRMKDGTVRYAWTDEQGKLHIDLPAAAERNEQ